MTEEEIVIVPDAPTEPPPATEIELEVKPDAAAALELITKSTASVVEDLAATIDAGTPVVVLPDAVEEQPQTIGVVLCNRCEKVVDSYTNDSASCHGETAELPNHAMDCIADGQNVIAFSAFTAPRFANGEPEEGQSE